MLLPVVLFALPGGAAGLNAQPAAVPLAAVSRIAPKGCQGRRHPASARIPIQSLQTNRSDQSLSARRRRRRRGKLAGSQRASLMPPVQHLWQCSLSQGPSCLRPVSNPGRSPPSGNPSQL